MLSLVFIRLIFVAIQFYACYNLKNYRVSGSYYGHITYPWFKPCFFKPNDYKYRCIYTKFIQSKDVTIFYRLSDFNYKLDSMPYFDIFTTNLSVKIILSNIGYFSVCTIGTVFLIFALHYTKAATVKSKIFKSAVFLPSTILFLLKSQILFSFIFESYQSNEVIGGNGFYITVAYNYLLLIISVCLMVGKILNLLKRISRRYF